ncbi:MAG: hypothetical protein ACRERV_08040 [Methylococcales bacterium]
MRSDKLKKLLLIQLALCTTGYCGLALSHDLNGGMLGDPFYSTDVYIIQCSTDSGGTTDYLEFKIIDITQFPGGGKVNLVVENGGFFTQTGDKKQGNADWSPVHSVHGGNGVYQAIVHKLKHGVKFYSFEYHCKSSTGAHTGTSITQIQNQ